MTAFSPIDIRDVIARFRISASAVVLWLSAAGFATPGFAQKVHNTYGSPLDTFRNTHLTTDVPPAKDFVTASSPDRKTLDYTPLTSPTTPDPERPKPLGAKDVAALQAELESAGARNERRAKGLMPRSARAGNRPARMQAKTSVRD